MANKNKTQTVGAYAPQKRPLFSTTVVEKGARIRLVTNAPPQEVIQETTTRRTRAD
jgi:hypothetical protein